MLHIEINNLNKSYGKKEVLKDINMKITNEKYNFIIGKNGIGKSTLVKCLNGIINYEGYINNKTYSISYCPEKANLPDYVSISNFLYMLGRINKIPIKELNEKLAFFIERFNLTEYKNTPIIKLSKGTKQKILIIQSLIKECDVYIFDEPLNGLDDNMQGVFVDELKKLKKHNKLILIITHNINAYPFKDINTINI